MEYMEIISVPMIVGLVYAVITMLKIGVKENETFMRFVPLIAAVLGAGLGVIAYFAAPDIIVADNVLSAVLVGGASGLAATGTNQIVKQLGKGKND